MTIEVELIVLTPQDLETELIVENDHIEIIEIGIMNERLVTQILEKGILLYILVYKTMNHLLFYFKIIS